MVWSVAIHGGAGLEKGTKLAFNEEEYHLALTQSLKAASQILEQGLNAI